MFHDTLRTEEATQEQKHKLFSSQLLLVESFQLHWLSFYLDDRDSSALHTVSVPPHKCFILIINKANQYIQYFHRSCCSALLLFSTAIAMVDGVSGQRSLQKYGSFNVDLALGKQLIIAGRQQTFHTRVQQEPVTHQKQFANVQNPQKKKQLYSS